MGVLVVGHQYQQDLESITVLTARLRQGVEPDNKLLLGLLVVMLGVKGTNIHED
jgi:hypothetical protein